MNSILRDKILKNKSNNKIITKQDVVNNILNKYITDTYGLDVRRTGGAFAPSNIALVKYWGKDNQELNIPYTDSLSISLGDLGAQTNISIIKPFDDNTSDAVYLNGEEINSESEFYTRIKKYLDLFRNYRLNNNPLFNYNFKIETNLNIPVAAGVASSACGFAALVKAFDDLFNLKISLQDLSILARLGSGSASRSLWDGFVYWQQGKLGDSSDCYAYELEQTWPELCIGLVILTEEKKTISSREAMQLTMKTSLLYQNSWKKQVEQDLCLIKKAIDTQDIELLGATAENNALCMHATMLSAKPAICYANASTIETMHKVWALRKQGIKVYFTQDAGPNLKLIFTRDNACLIEQNFAGVKIVFPYL